MRETNLPAWLTALAHAGNHVYAWRLENVRIAVETACDVGLACLGGEVQFILPDGIYEAYWLSFGPNDRRPHEPWTGYVRRARDETLAAFETLCRDADFTAIAAQTSGLSARLSSDDPMQFLWFEMYFEDETDEPDRAGNTAS